MKIQDRIIYVENGKGKSGKAKNGKVRMLFCSSRDLDKWNLFLSACYSYACEKYGGPIDKNNFFSNSYKSILGAEIANVFELKTIFGYKMYFVNNSSLDPRIDIVKELSKIESGDKKPLEG